MLLLLVCHDAETKLPVIRIVPDHLDRDIKLRTVHELVLHDCRRLQVTIRRCLQTMNRIHQFLIISCYIISHKSLHIDIWVPPMQTP